MTKSILLVALCGLLGACASAPPQPQPMPAAQAAVPASAPTPMPIAVAVGHHDYASDGLLATAWAQTAIEHDLIYLEVYRAAQAQLLDALADPHWDALPRPARAGSVAGLEPAVVLDIDETVLDNSPYQARLIKSGQAYNEATWADWVRQASARALPGALAFTQFAAKHGIAVIYISNRAAALTAPTLRNLRNLGFPVASDAAVIGLGTAVPGCKQVGSNKGCRRKLVAHKYRVLEQIGDQIGDFVNVTDNTIDGRAAAMAPYVDWIGQRWFMLPNPTYGSWQPALFGNDWSLGPAERHAREMDALRTN